MGELKPNETKSRDIIKYYAFATFFCIVLFYIGVLTKHTVDYPPHSSAFLTYGRHLFPIDSIEKLNALFFPTYPLWHWTGRLIINIIRCPVPNAAGIDTGIYLVVGYIGAIMFFKYGVTSSENFKTCILKVMAVLAFAQFIVIPINIPWLNDTLVVNTGGPTAWHNPTNICTKAVSIYCFFYSMKLLDSIINSNYKFMPSLKQILVLEFFYILSILAKPSFMQVYIPAFGIILIFYLFKSRFKFTKQFLIYCLLAVPIIFILFWQYNFFYNMDPNNMGIKSSVLGAVTMSFPTREVFITHIRNQFFILLFPILLLIYILIVKKKLNRFIAIAIIMEFTGLFYFFFVGGGSYGEMGWGLSVAEFFVFLVAFKEYIKCFLLPQDGYYLHLKRDKIFFVITTGALTAQVLTGLLYLYKIVVEYNFIL